MSFSKLSKPQLKVGDKIRLLPGQYSSWWMGIVTYIGDQQIKMFKPDNLECVKPGTTSYASYMDVQYEGIKWKRVTEKKNHLPNWL